MPSKEPKVFIIERIPPYRPMRFVSIDDVDVLWAEAMKKLEGKWWMPITFRDENGEPAVTLCLNTIVGVVRGDYNEENLNVGR